MKLSVIMPAYNERGTIREIIARVLAVDLAPLNSWNQVQTPETAWGRLSVESLAAHLRAEGLAGYAAEWWHWSYGDLEWARAYDQPPIFLPEHRDVEGPGAGI